RNRTSQPAENFRDVRGGALRRRCWLSRRDQSLARQMLCAFRDLDRERGSASELAVRADCPAVQTHELLHECETDAAAFVAASTRALDAVKALEDAADRLAR